MHYPLSFQNLLDQCPERVARIGQIENWLRENIDYYDWCSEIWSLTEHEEGSEEYAFCKIYDSLTEIFQIYCYESRIKMAMETFPIEEKDDNYVLWKWIKTHQSFYNDYFCLFDANYQIYDLCEGNERKHLTIPICCFRGIHLFIHKDDFSFVFDFIHLYDPYSYLEEPLDIDEQGNRMIIDQNYEEEETNDDFFDEEEEDEPQENKTNEYLLAEASLKKLLLHQHTMVDFQEILDWVEDHRKLKEKLENEHFPFCGCSTCDIFIPVFYEMDSLVTLFLFKNQYLLMVEKYDSLKNDPNALTDFYCRNYSLIHRIGISSHLNSKSNGLFVYDNDQRIKFKIHFVFIDMTMQLAYRDHELFEETALALHEYLIDLFNEENKTYYMNYNFNRLVQYFKSRLPKIAGEFFKSRMTWV